MRTYLRILAAAGAFLLVSCGGGGVADAVSDGPTTAAQTDDRQQAFASSEDPPVAVSPSGVAYSAPLWDILCRNLFAFGIATIPDICTQSSSRVSGRVVDGYLVGAQIFWDCNDNFKIDEPTEPWVTSEAGGRYTLQGAPNTACILRAVVPSWAIDETTGAIVGKEFRMSATLDNPSIISPITTLVTDAGYTEDSLRTLLGYQGSPRDDYIAKGDAGKSDAAIAGIIGTGLMSVNEAMQAVQKEGRKTTLLELMRLYPADTFSQTTLAGVTPEYLVGPAKFIQPPP